MQQEHWIAVQQLVWVHKNQNFYKAIIRQIYKQIVTCLLENGDILQVKKSNLYHRSPIPPNTSRTDLMETEMMNQAEILYALKLRFEQGKIYTFVENTMLVVNPYQLIPNLYEQKIKQYYMKNLILNKETNMKDLQPHIYSITASMISAIRLRKTNQAIVISGQSGAGKTEANKECLRFLGQYYNSVSRGNAQLKIQQAIMLSNPILQAFGNSKTIRNNNSSRFGKYLAISVNNKDEIKHAQIYNYLLEKSRIISRNHQEQNFHIFYEFLTKTTKTEKLKYCLLNTQTNQEMTFQDFNYTKSDQLTTYHENPEVSYNKIKQLLVILPNKSSYDYMCRILSAVLHLGNTEPYEDENQQKCDILPKQEFETVCNLLKVNSSYLMDALTSYSIKIGGEDLIKSFSKRQVQELIHSLSKTLYQKLFQWIINEINQSTTSDFQQQLLSMGFLDIYGFEILKTNSLQQLFINYTNERLHQIYLQYIFKLEKQHFKREKLDEYFRTVQFEDNLKVIELMDFDRLSVFNLLDEWCSVASPDASTFITKIRFNHKKHPKFPPLNLNMVSTQFLIRHTPQDIEYNAFGFREKNKDLLREEIKITMQSSKLSILNQMFTEAKINNDSDPTAHRVRKFLSSKFRKEINVLMEDILSKCDLHFIRCIKSNSTKSPMKMQEEVVYSQIKYMGILDTIKIKKIGYPTKVKYQELDQRFHWLVRRNILEPAFSNEIEKSLNQFLPRFKAGEIIFGIQRVFFRDFAFSILVKKYAHYLVELNQHAHRITSLFVYNLYRIKKQRKRRIILQIQAYLKGAAQNEKYNSIIEHIRLVQIRIRAFFRKIAAQKKSESIQILQAYIKRTLQVRNRLYQLQSAQKIINFFKKLSNRRRARKRLIVNSFIKDFLLPKVWNQIINACIATTNRYLQTFHVRIKNRKYIAKALKSENNQRLHKSLDCIQKFMNSFSKHILYTKYMYSIRLVQKKIKKWIQIRKYILENQKATLIQRAWREHKYKKHGAKSMFNQVYKLYYEQVQHQNSVIQKRLYDSDTQSAEGLNSDIKQYLANFRDKFSLFYWIVDFQAFIDLSIVYPNDSWIENYMQVYGESLKKQNPVQYLEVGETFTVIATTNRTYIWGMNEKYALTDNRVAQIKTHSHVEYLQVARNDLVLHYHSNEKKHFQACSTTTKDYNIDNGRLYQCLMNQLRPIDILHNNCHEKIVKISCGHTHVVLKTFSRRIYTFGRGHDGQLGHSIPANQHKPRLVKFFENIKTAYPIQVSAGFKCSIVMMSNYKIYWFGSNGTISKVTQPELLNLRTKSQTIGNTSQFCPVRIVSTWSRTMSVIGLTILCYNGRMKNNSSLKNKTTNVLIQKWQQVGLQHINPPLIPSISDHFEHLHVKIPKLKINIQPQSTKILKQMQQKIKSISSIETDNQMIDFSFANTQRSIFK